ncbi:MaoC family dehydratase [Streptomyces griseus]|uniref:MaoC family dehydratase n=1 Tax=Streptomyces griseus TaxID=1911 RepID=UPI0008404E66|nr:MaoC/PaaZ C-terminal domain-containing protein [Streptomyces griseus]
MTGLLVSLVRGAVTSPFKSAGRSGAALPPARAVLPAARIVPGRLASYRGICGFTERDVLPLTYPHVLGFPLAMRIMTGRAFPLPVLGLVHTRIEITGHRALHPADAPELTVYAEELTPHRRGTEVTVVTQARLSGELVWESRSGYLSRYSTGRAPATATPRGPAPSSPAAGGPVAEAEAAAAAEVEAEANAAVRAGDPAIDPAGDSPTGPARDALPAVAEWRLPGDLGRRYGAASGDRNPIHLHPLTARLFGFPRHIAHGMWTVARCLAEAEASGSGRIRTVRAEFRAPVLLPATVTYAAAGPAFEVRGAGRVHLTGRVTREG